MSSGFISGGTTDAPIERSDEWLAAQKEIEANALRRAEQARQQDGKSLFETLEANKAAKQDAFEEANRLKNQFRGVDEDEAEWLDSVLESTRAEEDRIKKETAEGLALFRQQQEEEDKKARRGGDGAAVEVGAPTEEESWAAGGRKRKRAKDKDVIKGVKLPRASASTSTSTSTSSSTEMKPTEASPAKPSTKPQELQSRPSQKVPHARPAAADNMHTPNPPKSTSGLVNYGSDEDDDW